LTIEIKRSPTADTRTCNWANVTKDELLRSSRQHIADVASGMKLFETMLGFAAMYHDADKIDDIADFHADFVTGFKQTTWWDNHRKTTRHHLNAPDGVPPDVNLIDVIEHVVDCVMAGMARSGSVYELNLPDEVLQKALKNTVELLKKQVRVT
jgi:hypothetical protein